MNGLDYSWARPGGAAIKAAGFDFVMRYVAYPGDGGKGLTPYELADLQNQGLSVGVVFESTAGRMLEGETAGRQDASASLGFMQALGFPDNRPVYFACDFDAQESQYSALDAYLEGAAKVLGLERVGIYGSFAVIEHCRAVESAGWFWQTYAWSAGQRSQWCNVYQYLNGQELNGGAVDYCESYGPDFGAWKAEEAEMTDEQFRAMFEKYMGIEFPAYIEAYHAGGFSARNGVVSELNPEGKGPVKPWLPDIEATIRARAAEIGRDQ